MANIETSKRFRIIDLIDYMEGGVSSRQIIKSANGNITLFSFSAGEGLSEHTAPYDAMVHILTGSAVVTIDGKRHDMGEGDMIIMPAGVLHALHADQDFKMILVMIKSS